MPRSRRSCSSATASRRGWRTTGLQAGDSAQAGTAFNAAAERSREASSLAEQCDDAGRGGALLRAWPAAPAERFDALLRRARTLASNDLGADAQRRGRGRRGAGDERRAAPARPRRPPRADGDARRGERVAAPRRPGDRRRARARPHPTSSCASRSPCRARCCDARRADEAVLLLEPLEPWVRAHADFEPQWEYWAAHALALDYANRLGDAMPAWDAARAVAQRANRRDMLWKTMANSASTQAKMGLVEQAAQLGRASAPDRLRVERGASACACCRCRSRSPTACATSAATGARSSCSTRRSPAMRRSGASHSDFALAEQRLVVLYQQLGQPARALHLLAPERPGVPRGVAMIRLAHRAELEAQMGRDGLRADARGAADHPERRRHLPSHRHAVRDAAGSGRRGRGPGGQPGALGDDARAPRRRALGPRARGRLRARARRAGAGAAARRGGAPPGRRATCPTASTCPSCGWCRRRTLATLGREPAARRAAADGQAWVQRSRTTRTCRPSSATASCSATRSTAS